MHPTSDDLELILKGLKIWKQIILKWWDKLCMSINWIFKYNEFMEYKRAFLLRCCNTAIVRFRTQLIAYREPLCKFEKCTPSEWCSPVGTWFGKKSLGWILGAFMQCTNCSSLSGNPNCYLKYVPAARISRLEVLALVIREYMWNVKKWWFLLLSQCRIYLQRWNVS